MKKKSGFTILEITFAITIFTIGILGIITLFPQGMKSVKVALLDLNMMVVGENVMKNIKHELEQGNSVPGETRTYNKNYPDDSGIYMFEIDAPGGSVIREIDQFDFEYKVDIEDKTDLMIDSSDIVSNTLRQIELVLRDKKSGKEQRFYSFVARKV